MYIVGLNQARWILLISGYFKRYKRIAKRINRIATRINNGAN